MHYWPWYLIERNITLCVNGLSDNYKHVANGEILGVTLMMEDLLNCTTCSNIFKDKNGRSWKENFKLDSHSNQSNDVNDKKKSKLIQNYKEWKFFLMTWKRCEILKLDWGRRKIGVYNINNTEIFSRFK